jgi:drug/metabolite transporter (DMT)-like permease
MGLPGIFVALCFACATTSFIVALSLTSVAQVLVIISSVPLIAAVGGRIFLGERIGRNTIVTIGVAMGGFALMVSADLSGDGSLLGDFFAALIALSYAALMVTMRKYPSIGMVPAGVSGLLIAVAIALAFASHLAVSNHDLAILLGFGIIQNGFAIAFLVAGAKMLPAAHTALISLLEPIFGPVWVWLLFGEVPTVPTLIGGGIVLGAVAINTFLQYRAVASGAPDP